jgi:hypothetical protein
LFVTVLAATALSVPTAASAHAPFASQMLPSPGSGWLTDPRLDQVAAQVSGFPIHVFGYASFDVWRHDWDQDENRTMFGAASGARGQFTVFLSPAVWFTLLADLDQGPAAGGTQWSALAIMTLLHVSIYQGNVERGLIQSWRYEGVTSCSAIKALPQYAGRFGFTQTIAVQSEQPIKRHGKIVGWRRVTRTAPNPAYPQLLNYAAEWQRYLFGADCPP